MISTPSIPTDVLNNFDPPSLALRSATIGDIPLIRRLAEETWKACYPKIIPPGQIDYMLRWMYSQQTLHEEISGGAIWYGIIATEGSHPIGYAALGSGAAEHEGHMHKFYIHPAFHGRGFGSAALTRLLAKARSMGFRQLSLRVNRSNKAAIHCYRKAGFLTHREICSEIGSGFIMDDYWMICPLAPGPGT